MSIALRCHSCQEWLHQPKNGWVVCLCNKLSLSCDGKVRGLYSEFWNEEKDLHFDSDTPKGM
jgi:hypothetical protein